MRILPSFSWRVKYDSVGNEVTEGAEGVAWESRTFRLGCLFSMPKRKFYECVEEYGIISFSICPSRRKRYDDSENPIHIAADDSDADSFMESSISFDRSGIEKGIAGES